jgi:glycosyltransferase involved in cell wall biosynthesis
VSLQLRSAQKRVIFLTNTESLPLVSVLIPTKNRPQFLELALNSALQQTYKNIEIIISDESNNDETEKLIQSYLHQFPQIRYVKYQENVDYVNNFNYLFKLSNGEFINYLMDVDLFHPEKIEKMMQHYLSDSELEIRIVTSHRQKINECGESLPDSPVTKKLYSKDIILDGISFGNKIFKNYFNYIGEPTTVLFRKLDLKEPFGVFEGRIYDCNADLATWMNLLSDGKMVYISESLSYIRIYNKQHLNSTEKLIKGAAEYGHSILTSPKKDYLQKNEQYRESVQSCISQISSTLKKNKHIASQIPAYIEAKTYLQFLEQLYLTIQNENVDIRKKPRICFAILAHENEGILRVQIENVRRFNPNSFIVVYNGGPNKKFAQNLDIPVCPYSQPLRYGNLTRYFYDTMRWLEELNVEYDFFINLDNDVLFIKEGFEEFIEEAMQGYDCMGPHMHIQHSRFDYPRFIPGLTMWREWDKWQPFFKTNFFARYFNPGQVYSRKIIRKMLSFESFDLVENLWRNSNVAALEEMFWITFSICNGGKCREYPWDFTESLQFVRHKPEITKEEVTLAIQKPHYYWIHPIKGNNLIDMHLFLKKGDGFKK